MRRLRCLPFVLLAACAPEDAATLRVEGTVEVREIDMAPMSPGRVRELRVEEGAAVQPGDTLAVLTQATLAPNIDAARAREETAAATLRDLQAGSRPMEIARAEAELGARAVEAERASRDRDRMRGLAERQVISRQQLEAAEAAAEVARRGEVAARESLALLRAGSRPERIAAARAEVASARATRAAAEGTASDLVLVAPARAVVLSRNAEPGDMLAAGTPALTLGVVAEPWVRAYVPARVLPALRVGGAVDVRPAGSATTVHYRGRLAAINPRAEYVTRTALTDEERADLLFSVKVLVDDTTGALKPGLPATLTFDLPVAGVRAP